MRTIEQWWEEFGRHPSDDNQEIEDWPYMDCPLCGDDVWYLKHEAGWIHDVWAAVCKLCGYRITADPLIAGQVFEGKDHPTEGHGYKEAKKP
jgi:hypothetical protein